MDDQQEGPEARYESARRRAAEAHDAAGDAEDALVEAERQRDDDTSASPAGHRDAQEHVDQVEGEWRLRLEEADRATERRDRARDSFEAGTDDAGGDGAGR